MAGTEIRGGRGLHLSLARSCHNYICTSIIFVATKVLCFMQHVFVATSILLLRQKTVSMLFATKFCRDKFMFVATNICCEFFYFCRDKHNFVATKEVFCGNKHVFVTTKLLSRQKLYFWQLPPMIYTVRYTVHQDDHALK